MPHEYRTIASLCPSPSFSFSSLRVFHLYVGEVEEGTFLPLQRIVPRSQPLVVSSSSFAFMFTSFSVVHVSFSTFCTSFVSPGRFHLFVRLTDRWSRTIDRYKFDRL